MRLRVVKEKRSEARMSLFKCTECGVVENTATSGYWFRRGATPLCSQCDPNIGKWHGIFPRQDADEAGYVQVPNSFYIQLPQEG